MRRTHKYRKYIIIMILFFLIMILIFISYKKKVQQYTANHKEFKLNSLTTKVSINDVEVDNYNMIIKYNNIWLPMNEIFNKLFPRQYKTNITQVIQTKTMEIDIDYDNNKITIPNYTTYNNQKMDNSIIIEIEEFNNKKYIPLYFISNLDEINIKLDGTEIYENENYINSISAIKENAENHSIEIMFCEEKNIEENYFGQSMGSLWREEALKRIEKYKKNDIKIITFNQDKIMYDNAQINLKILNNDFKFGTSLTGSTTSGYYKWITTDLFNTIGAENAFKWGFTTKNGYTCASEINQYGLKKNMNVRGHCLWWDYICSEELNNIVGNLEECNEGTMAFIYKNYNEGNITLEKAEELSLKLQDEFEKIVLNHIEEEVKKFPNINEWDVVNEILSTQYFKKFLYDRDFLNDNTFLSVTKIGSSSDYTDNENYYKFIAKCFDKVRELKENCKLVLNDNTIHAKIEGINIDNDIRVINNIKKHTDNLNALGIEYHVGNRYYYSPLSYYNNLNSILPKIDISDIVITEYDNYNSSKLGKYTQEENQIRADYLRDTLIMAYSNPNISEFCFWVYNGSNFCNEERQAYIDTVNPWLNYTETGTSNENGYQTRLYKGDYTVTVTLPNGKSKTAEFKVGDNNSNTVEVVFESELERIEVSKLPDKTKYYQDDIINLDGGKITAFYDDGTSQEIDLNSNEVLATGFDKTKIGKQTITISYKNKNTSFEIEMKEDITEDITNIITNINNKTKTVYENYQTIFSNPKIQQKYTKLINDNNEIITNIYGIDKNTITNLINNNYILSCTIIQNMNSSNQTDSLNIIENIIIILDDYKRLLEYYIENDELSAETVKNILNDIISKYNANTNIDISNATALIEQSKDLYNNDIRTDDILTNYYNKIKITKICGIASQLIDYDINQYNNSNNNTNQNDQESTNIIQNSINNNTQTNLNEIPNTSQTSNSTSQNQIEPEQQKENIRSGVYRIENNYIKNTTKNTTPNSLLNNLGLSNSFLVYRGEHILTNTFAIATGDILKYYDNNYTLEVLGDINQDSWVNIRDLVRFRNVILGSEQLNQAENYAADITQDNKVNLSDLVSMRNLILSD